MSNDLWRWADPDGQQRKVRLDELRAALAGGLIAPNTPVWRAGWRAWQPAHEVPELTSASFGGANGVVLNIPPPPLAMVAVQQEYEASSSSIVPAPPIRPTGAQEEEPPPPPSYVPIPGKSPPMAPSSGNLKTQLGGSAHVPVAPGSTPAALGSSPVPIAPGSTPKLGPSQPTKIGIPPPPEVLAAALATRPRSAPPPAPPAKPKAPGAAMIEELSGSMLLDSASSGMDLNEHSHNGASGASGVTADGLLPPPTDPIVRDESDDTAAEDMGLPRRPGLSLILDDIAEIRQGRPPKNKLVFAVIGVVGLSVVIMLIAGIVSLVSGPSSSDTKKTASSASVSSTSAPTTPTATTSAAAIPAPAPIPAPPPPEPRTGPSLGDCTATGEAKSIAPRAVIASAIEAHALGSGLALGFASTPRDAVATSLDPATLAPMSTVRTRPTGGDARRVTPMLVNGKLTAMPDVDRKGDRLAGRRIVAASTLIDVGFVDGGIVWAPHGRDSFAKLFALEGDAGVEALRAVALTDRKGIAVTFRRGNSINVGVAKGDGVLDADGELSKIPGLGQVGSPAIAASGDRVIVAWADRAGASDDWKLRYAKIKIGASTGEATPFTLPEGGLGEQAMSPSVASLGGGRFLLAWTEGPVSNHQVRAITIGADGSPSGSPIAISASGANAGQPAAVVGPDGRGAVAFLAAKGKALEVQATPISCPAR